MAKKSKKEKQSIMLPNAWESVRHKNDTAQAKANYEDTWKAVGVIAGILLFLFVILGGISMTGTFKLVMNWSNTIGTAISDWIAGGSMVVNEDGVYYDPSGSKGSQIKDNGAEKPITADEVIEDAKTANPEE